MAQQIGGIYVDLGLNTAAFSSGLTAAQGRLAKFGTSTRATLAGIGGNAFGGFAKGALLAIAPILSVGAAVRGAKDALQEFGDVADNATAAGLDAEFFQGIAYQAKLGGLEIGAVSGALATFAKNSGLAAEGKGRMTTALKALDPVLLENIRHAATQEQRILLVADALAHETDASRKAAIATAAFGDAGSKLAGVFAGGAAQIEAMQVKARQLGLIVDRDLIARADQLGDEFDTTTKIVDLQLKQALVNLGPILVWLSGLAGGLASQLGHAIDGLKELEQQSSSTIEGRLAGIDLQANDTNPAMAAGLSPDDVAKAKAPLLAELRKRAIDSLRDQLTSRPPALDDVPTLEEIEARNRAAAAAVAQGEAIKALIANLEFEKSTLGLSAVDMQVATSLREAGATATDEQKAKIEDLIRTIADEQTALEANTEAMQAFADTAHNALGGFIDDLIEGKSLAEALGGVLSGLGNRLLNAGLDSLFSTSSGSPLASLFGLPGRASGGPVTAGRPYIVGEKRPEVFVPNTSGRIVPNVANLRGVAGQGGGPAVTVNYSIDARGADQAAVDRLERIIKSQSKEFESKVKKVVVERGKTWR